MFLGSIRLFLQITSHREGTCSFKLRALVSHLWMLCYSLLHWASHLHTRGQVTCIWFFPVCIVAQQISQRRKCKHLFRFASVKSLWSAIIQCQRYCETLIQINWVLTCTRVSLQRPWKMYYDNTMLCCVLCMCVVLCVLYVCGMCACEHAALPFWLNLEKTGFFLCIRIMHCNNVKDSQK